MKTEYLYAEMISDTTVKIVVEINGEETEIIVCKFMLMNDINENPLTSL